MKKFKAYKRLLRFKAIKRQRQRLLALELRRIEEAIEYCDKWNDIPFSWKLDHLFYLLDLPLNNDNKENIRNFFLESGHKKEDFANALYQARIQYPNLKYKRS